MKQLKGNLREVIIFDLLKAFSWYNKNEFYRDL